MAIFEPKIISWLIYVCLLLFGSVPSYVWSESKTIKCIAPDSTKQRIWKYLKEEETFKFWTYYDGKFHPFCSVGYKIQFPSGFLCSYHRDKKIGTVATYIDVRDMKVTDILIWEDTVLDNPKTWKQKSESLCEMIRE